MVTLQYITIFLLSFINIHRSRSVMEANRSTMQIFVKNLSGVSILFNVKPSDTISSLMHKIALSEGGLPVLIFLHICIMILILIVSRYTHEGYANYLGWRTIGKRTHVRSLHRFQRFDGLSCSPLA